MGKEASYHKEKGVGFWSIVLDNFSGVKLEREEACQAEKCDKGVTGWNDPVKERTSFVEAACQNYEALVEEKRVGNGDGVGPSRRYETRGTQRREEPNPPQVRNER